MQKIAVMLADIADGAVKGGAAFEGPIDMGLRIALPQGVSIVVGKLREVLDETMIPAENENGEAYSISVRELALRLLSDD